jgi:hypothetical protein
MMLASVAKRLSDDWLECQELPSPQPWIATISRIGYKSCSCTSSQLHIEHQHERNYPRRSSFPRNRAWLLRQHMGPQLRHLSHKTRGLRCKPLRIERPNHAQTRTRIYGRRNLQPSHPNTALIRHPRSQRPLVEHQPHALSAVPSLQSLQTRAHPLHPLPHPHPPHHEILPRIPPGTHKSEQKKRRLSHSSLHREETYTRSIQHVL